jgi:hypothetical protein
MAKSANYVGSYVPALPMAHSLHLASRNLPKYRFQGWICITGVGLEKRGLGLNQTDHVNSSNSLARAVAWVRLCTPSLP